MRTKYYFPRAERNPWEDCFARVMASLEITRDAETTDLRVRRKLLERLALTTMWQGLRVPSAKIRVDTILAIERQRQDKDSKEL